MAKPFRTLRFRYSVQLQCCTGGSSDWGHPCALTSAQCRSLAFDLLRHSTDIEREETDRLQGDLPLLYERT